MAARVDAPALDVDPLWYKDAIIYQTHVRAFHDSNGDGIGDFPGLTLKLDYLRDLGVTTIWVLPFYPSPLRDDGYDTADFTDVHAAYGNLAAVRTFIREAHRRGLRVITELVCNHTSDQHPWFQRARRSKPGTVWRDFYVWSNSPDRYADARIIFTDFETSNWTWDPVANAYFWHRFYHHQPDLNFENPRVQAAIIRVLEFWLDLGVDGLRLDAVPYLYEAEGTNCENLPKTHEMLKRLRAHIDQHYPGRMLLAEANQWPEDAVAYFGSGVGDECNMCFHFPLMPRMFLALQLEDRNPIIDILDQTPAIPESAQWAIFLRNHDELTLEMVTDEERDYMYRVYAHDPSMRINLGIRRRLAPLLGNNRRRIELMNGLLFSLPGTPVIYYGDEIGMGDNVYLGDRNGVRTPMQWNSDRNAGFSTANRQRIYAPVIVDPEYHFEAVNVEAQQANPQSLLWWMKRLVSLRKAYPAFSRGSLELLQPANRKVFAFVREHDGETLLVIANLSRFVQAVELDLCRWQGCVPVELFGRTMFPPIGELPYFITLGPHSFYWFVVQPSPDTGQSSSDSLARNVPVIRRSKPWSNVDDPSLNRPLGEALKAWLSRQTWFAGSTRSVTSIDVTDRYEVGEVELVLLRAAFADGDPELYAIPIHHTSESLDDSERTVARVEAPNGALAIREASDDAAFGHDLFNLIRRRRRIGGRQGTLAGVPLATRGIHDLDGGSALRVAEGSHGNMVFRVGDNAVLKVFRKIEDGIHPEVEMGRLLAQRAGSTPVGPLLGTIERVDARGSRATIGVLHAYVPNQGDARSYAQDALEGYWDRVMTRGDELSADGLANQLPVIGSTSVLPALAWELIGPFLAPAATLGQRTAELHLALASGAEPDFAPEPFSLLYQRSVFQSMRANAVETWRLLRGRRKELAPSTDDLERVVEAEREVLGILHQISEKKFDIARIRVHGDYHLGQVLFTGTDFVIIDLEGEAAHPLGRRRIKRSALRDIAGMCRSFDEVVRSSLRSPRDSGLREGRRSDFDPVWARFWSGWVAAAFVNGYIDAARQAPFVPDGADDLRTLMRVYLLDRTIHELRDALIGDDDLAMTLVGDIAWLLADQRDIDA